MEDHSQTEQPMEPDEEQLQVIAGGGAWDRTMNEALKMRDMGEANMYANLSRNEIRKNARAGTTFDVPKAWADRLVTPRKNSNGGNSPKIFPMRTENPAARWG